MREGARDGRGMCQVRSVRGARAVQGGKEAAAAAAAPEAEAGAAAGRLAGTGQVRHVWPLGSLGKSEWRGLQAGM